MPFWSDGKLQGGGSGTGLTPAQSDVLDHLIFNPVTDQLESDRAFESILNSFKLGKQWTISSGGEQIYFKSSSTGFNHYAAFGAIKDQSLVGNQGASGIVPPQIRTLADNLEFVRPLGIADTSGAVPYEVVITTTSAASVFAIEVIVEEAIVPEDWIAFENFAGSDATGTKIYLQHVTGLTLAPGDTLKINFDQPIDRETGSQIFAQIVKKPGRDGAPVPLQVRRSLTVPTRPWFELSRRSFVDTRIADRQYVMRTLLGETVGNLFTDSVEFHADLPLASTATGQVWRVRKRTANYWTLGVTARFLAGYYESDGTNWILRPNAALPTFDIAQGDNALSPNYRQYAPVDMKYIHDDGHHGLNPDPDSFAHGVNALSSTTTGTSNTAIGTDAGAAITGGFMNTGVGQGAMKAITGGFFNTAVGMLALSTATGQFDNTAVGMAALKFSVANSNTAIGSRAIGGSVTTGADNVAVGVDALNKLGSGSRNVAIGTNASFNSTVGKSNIAIGHSALISNITGDGNVAIGDKALFLATGNFNTAFGTEAGSFITTAIDNVLIGMDAYRLGTASGNTVVGIRAMSGATATGIDNTAIGRDALFSATTATDNVAVGRDTLKSALTAKSNVAMGPAVMMNILNGDFNVGLGHQTLLALTDGNDAIGIGFATLPNLTTGNFNIALGCDSGAGIITGSNNIMIGEGTGFSSDVSQMMNIGNSMYLSMASSNFVGFGVEFPQHSIHIQRAGETVASLEAFSAASSLPMFRVRRSGSGTVGSFTALTVGEELGRFEFHGSDDTGWLRGAYINAAADETFTGTGAGTTLRFFTTPIGAIGATERFTIGESQVFYNGVEVATLDDIVGAAEFAGVINAAPPADTGGFLAGQLMINTPTSVLNTDQAGISGHSAFGGNTQLWYMGSNPNSSQAIMFQNRSTFGNVSLFGANGGLTVSGINGSVTHDAFTILGAGNVNIKVKTVVGTSPSTQGGSVTIAHGLTLSKIMGFTIQVSADNGNLIPPEFEGVAGFHYHAFLTSTSISITNKASDSSNMLSNLVRAIITYSP